MITVRTRRMLRELQCDPMTLWFCELFRVLEPREVPGANDAQDRQDLPTRFLNAA